MRRGRHVELKFLGPLPCWLPGTLSYTTSLAAKSSGADMRLTFDFDDQNGYFEFERSAAGPK